MKNELYDLYTKHQGAYQSVLAAHPGENMAGPHLISPNELYAQQQNRLLIVGQETGGWAYHIDDISKQMEFYEDFNLGERYYRSPFWNVTRKVERALGNAPYSSAWSNISKFDHNDRRSTGRFEASISTVDGILREEIAILKPTVCLFYTGPEFESRLCGVFKSMKFHKVDGFEERQLARVEHKDLPAKSYRTYHPNYLRRSKLEAAFVRFIEEQVR